jgi:uncharacterized membrane protein HdeD (DUF308 family)
MLAIVARNWWTLVLRGVVAILFGVVAWIWTGDTLRVLVYLFGAYALVDGVFALAAIVIGGGREGRWLPLLIEGIAGIAAGIATLLWPDLTALALLYFIAAWALVTGVFEVVAAVHLRREIEDEWLLGLSGLASVVFGLLLVVARPDQGALAIVWLIGLYAIIFGALLVGVGLRLRGMADRLPTDRPVGA